MSDATPQNQVQKFKVWINGLSLEDKAKLKAAFAKIDSTPDEVLSMNELLDIEKQFEKKETDWDSGGKFVADAKKSRDACLDNADNMIYPPTRHWLSVPSVQEQEKHKKDSDDCIARYRETFVTDEAKRLGFKLDASGEIITRAPSPAYDNINGIIGDILKGERPALRVSPAEIIDGLGLLHRHMVTSLAASKLAGNAITGWIVKKQVVDAIMEFNQSLREIGAPTIALDYADKLMEEAKARRNSKASSIR